VATIQATIMLALAGLVGIPYDPALLLSLFGMMLLAEIARAGADTFVAGSAIFGSTDYRATIQRMREALASL